MKTKSYIAVFLTLIFLAKFAAIDANGLNALFGGKEISFVKQNCKKLNSPKQLDRTADFSQSDPLASHVIAIHIACTSQFQLELLSWELTNLKPITVFNEHLTSVLSYLYFDNDFPPPQLA